MTQEILSSVIILLPLVLQLVGLTIAVLTDPYISVKHRHVMLIIAAFVFILILQNNSEYLLEQYISKPFLRTVVAVIGYSIRPMILVLFYYIVGKRKSYRPAWILIGVNAAIHMTAFFSGICFSISESNRFSRGPLGYSCHIISAILLAYLIYLTAKEFTRMKRSSALIPAVNASFIIIAVLFDSFVSLRNYPVSLLTITIVSSCVFYYIWLHLQFVREHERALMAEQRIQIMMSQIQPHFLYNTLSTIQALCKTDPEKAFITTEKFGTYLRQNIDSLSQPKMIPIQKELEHVRIYAEIESIRFPSVRVEYDTPDLDFQIPALTIQPLVENAIRHGVRIRKVGIVTVSTRKTPSGHEIEIRDNGKGFDVNASENSEGSHIGIRNVRERIEKMCGGTVEINSVPDEGTTVVIAIPNRHVK